MSYMYILSTEYAHTHTGASGGNSKLFLLYETLPGEQAGGVLPLRLVDRDSSQVLWLRRHSQSTRVALPMGCVEKKIWFLWPKPLVFLMLEALRRILHVTGRGGWVKAL
jgi:hypothetical protein